MYSCGKAERSTTKLVRVSAKSDLAKPGKKGERVWVHGIKNLLKASIRKRMGQEMQTQQESRQTAIRKQCLLRHAGGYSWSARRHPAKLQPASQLMACTRATSPAAQQLLIIFDTV